jgi:TRAP-type C4-dicarboxylate transport system permease small subunit
MDRLIALERAVTRGLEGLITLCFAVLALLVVALVVLRYVFNTTIIGGNEVTAYLFIYTTALGAAVSVSNGQHIRIAVFVDRLAPAVRRLVEAGAVSLVLALHAGLLWLSSEWIGSVGGFEFPVVHIPQGLIQAALPIGCGFVILFCLVRLIALACGRPTPD